MKNTVIRKQVPIFLAIIMVLGVFAAFPMTAEAAPPSPPITATPQYLISGSIVADLQATGTAVKWYDDSSGGVPISNSEFLGNGITYWASQTVAGEESLSRAATTVIIQSGSGTISIDTQPQDVTVIQDGISEKLTISAIEPSSHTIKYRWFSNTTDSNTGGTHLGAMSEGNKSFAIPSDLTAAGSPYYFYCVVSADQAPYKVSDVAKVTVIPSISRAAITGIVPPVPGYIPIKTAPPDGTGYTCSAVTWTPADMHFTIGTAYTASVTLTAETGLVFPPGFSATVNGNPAKVTVAPDGESVLVEYQFTAHPAIVDVTPPAITKATSVKTLSSIYLVKGKSVTLPAAVQPYNATDRNVTWSSAKPSIAKVNEKTGKVTAGKTAGKSTILTVKSNDGKKMATCKVYVVSKQKKLKKLTLKPGKTTGLKAGNTMQVKPKFKSAKSTGIVPTYTSSNKKVAIVDKTGVITALKAGTTAITVKAGNKKKKFTLNVGNIPAMNIALDKTSVTVKKGGEVSISGLSIAPADTDPKTITWITSDKKIATVSSKGLVKGISKGKATITAMTWNGKKATCKVTVK